MPVSGREIGGVVQPSVSARDVHTFLASARWFGNWFDREVQRCSLVRDLDYALKAVSNKVIGNSRVGRPRREALFTLAAAKKVAMAAAGPRGFAVRDYFIECERRLLAGEGPIPGSIDPAPVAVPLPDWRASLVADRSAQPSMPDRSIRIHPAKAACLDGVRFASLGW